MMSAKPTFRCGLIVLGTCRIRYRWQFFHYGLRRPYGSNARHKSLTDNLKMVRNVGIMAHIDAGKTTTTERMLYYAGMIDYPGEVHHGDTVTDFLPQERERGITIQSAVVSFPWKEDYRINLIDTPGHVDFTYEVERSVRAVDSAVAILDASAGVEAQTLTVWRQATENKLPRMIYLNKMDKNTSSIKMCLESIKNKLKAQPVLLQLPIYSKDVVIGKGSGIIGIVDLVQMKKIIFHPDSKGKRTKTISALEDADIVTMRQELVEQVADFDAELATTIIETESVADITNDQLDEAIKRITMDGQVVPVILGSSYKNVGVQQVLDCIIKYLPHPGEVAKREKVVVAYGQELCAFVFKTLHDKQLGALTFLRIFSGSLKSGDKIFNVSKSKQEKIQKVFQPLANDLREINFVGPGQVTVVSGLKETYTGDTITSSSSIASAAKSRLKKNKDFDGLPVIPGVAVPEPVFFCSIEPASLSHQKLLDEALICLQREDPSLKVNTDPDTGQTVLSGMGELHIEIIHDRLKKEYKVDADLGKLSVAYKETILEPGIKRIDFERRLADQTHKVGIELSLTPKDNVTWKIVLAPGKEAQENLNNLKERQERCIQNGVDSALRFGPKLGFPLVDVEVMLHAFQASKYTSDAIVAAAAATCVRQILQEMEVVLLEPMVDLFITTDERSQSAVMDDLNRRRFLLKYIDIHQGNKVINGTAPLAELMGYSTALRTISSGLGTYTMQFSHYQKVMNRIEEENIISAVRGFH